MSKIQTTRQFKGMLLGALFLASLISGIAFCYAGKITGMDRLTLIGLICGIINLIPLSISAVLWALKNQIDKGILYAWKHYTLVLFIRHQLLHAGIYNIVKIGSTKLAEIPWVTAYFSPDYKNGTVYIKNSIRYHDTLCKIDLSPSLGRYVVEQVYLTDNENHYRFDIYDSSLERRLVFNSLKEFKAYSDTIGQYELFVDNYTKLTLTHQLLAGQTGSGKSYALKGYIIQMLLKPVKYHLYFADPKAADIACLGEKISPDTTSDNFEGIVALLENFVSEMHKRQRQIKKRLLKKYEGDYRDFGMPPYILIFDEYADFALFLLTKDKKQRDYVNSLISQIVLKGRQAGCFLWIVMQQAGSNNLPTFIRDNLPWKTVFGNAEDQTYVTAFGAGADIPLRKMEIGDGVYTYPSVANKPRLCSASTLGFDISEALEAGVM